MSNDVIMAVAMGVWLMSTAVFIGASTRRIWWLATQVSCASVAGFTGAVFGWSIATCMLGYLVGMLILLLFVVVAERLQKLPPAQHHDHHLP